MVTVDEQDIFRVRFLDAASIRPLLKLSTISLGRT